MCQLQRTLIGLLTYDVTCHKIIQCACVKLGFQVTREKLSKFHKCGGKKKLFKYQKLSKLVMKYASRYAAAFFELTRDLI